MSYITPQTIDYNLTLQESMISADAIDLSHLANINGNLSSFSTTLNTEVGDYLKKTDTYAYQNELYNANRYINQNMTLQESEISDLSEKARNQIMKIRQKYQLKIYDIQYFRFIAAVLSGFLFVFAVCFVLLAMAYKQQILSGKVAWLISSTIVILYLIVLLFWLRENSRRTHTEWNKLNFGSYGNPNGTSCSA